MRNSENSMNINLNRLAVIAKLQERKAELEKEAMSIIHEWAQFNVNIEQYRKQLIFLLTVESGDNLASLVSDCDVYYDDRVQFNFKVADGRSYKAVARPKQPQHSIQYAENRIAEVDQMINLLGMCSDETIKSKSYGNILKYIS